MENIMHFQKLFVFFVSSRGASACVARLGEFKTLGDASTLKFQKRFNSQICSKP
jgi:hypothetical protein